ncbi:MAG: hypothetical protein VX519_04730 [Myxococcota bacterium]|nr:hypothetical protein [Myxococcota bacterium]
MMIGFSTLWALLACQPDVEPQLFSGCDPLDPALCALPFPSAFFLSEDASTPTGYRVSFGEESLPENIDLVQVRPDFFNEKDGFSTTGALLTYFEDVSLEGVIGHEEIEAYASDSVKTIIVNADTGERVPHFVEIDNTTEEVSQRLLSLQPMVPLDFASRYVVGIRGLVQNDGNPVPPSEIFEELRDSVDPEAWDFEGRREHFEEVVFPTLSDQGFERGELQLAWDFVTVSRENSLGRLEWMRDDALERSDADGLSYSIDSVEEGDCAAGDKIARTLEGTFVSPLYTEEDDEGTVLTRDADGMPYYNGDTDVRFLVRIPCSLAENPRPSRIVQYGHGLLGNRGEAKTGHLSDVLNQADWSMIAVDWTGMADRDRGEITMMLVIDPSEFAILPERSMQGFVQMALSLEFAIRELAADEHMAFDGVNVIDPAKTGYYGISQGGILGGGYVAMSTRLERAVLGVPGAPYDLLLQRSADFDPFFDIFKTKFRDHRDIRLMLGLMQMLWDPAESSGWLQAMNQDPGPGTAPKQVLLQSAIGDAQVTTLGAQVMARAYQASTVAPQTREIFGVSEQEGGFEGSALVEWYYPDGAEEPVENVPPDKSKDTHECPRREPAAQAQLIDFLETGIVNQYCLDEDGNPTVCQGVRAGLCD